MSIPMRARRADAAAAIDLDFVIQLVRCNQASDVGTFHILLWFSVCRMSRDVPSRR